VNVQRLKAFLAVVVVLLLSSSFAIASDSAEHDIPWKNFAFRVANFAAVLGIIYYFFGKKIIGFFKARSEGISKEITSLEERKLEAAKQLKEVEKRIANLERECQTVLEEYVAQGEAMKTAIIAQAEKTAEQITSTAKKTAENEIHAAIDGMRTEIAEQIVAATEKLLAKKLSVSEHTKLIDKYLTKVVLN
jgi:F-type H+-transporting ATPase subunit b